LSPLFHPVRKGAGLASLSFGRS